MAECDKTQAPADTLESQPFTHKDLLRRGSASYSSAGQDRAAFGVSNKLQALSFMTQVRIWELPTKCPMVRDRLDLLLFQYLGQHAASYQPGSQISALIVQCFSPI